MTVTITICETCRTPDRAAGGGAALLDVVRAIAPAELTVTGYECLWSCGAGASVQLSGTDRTTYIMGHFAVADARAIVDFALAYAATADGEVAFENWPAPILGHFLARVPIRRGHPRESGDPSPDSSGDGSPLSRG